MIRTATPADATAIITIYNHYIATTTISFEENPVSEEEMAQRIRDVTANMPWYVEEQDGQVVATPMPHLGGCVALTGFLLKVQSMCRLSIHAKELEPGYTKC